MRLLGRLSSRWTACICLVSTLSCLLSPAFAVKEHDFKKCHQAGFCKRNRAYADHAITTSSTWLSPYNILPETVTLQDGQFKAIVLKTINEQGETVRLPITVSFLESGVARVTLDEEKRQKKEIDLRHNSSARKERYNEAEDWVIVGGLALDKTAKIDQEDKTYMTVKYGPSDKFEAVIKYSPFSADFKSAGSTQVSINDRGLMNMEHWRPKVEKAEPVKEEGEVEKEEKKEEEPNGEDESTWWDESFGGNTDSKPRGPESVALDITFVGYEHVFGIPLHTGPLSLKETRGGEGNYDEPYRLFNADVFEYILDSPMTLYGAIPFMQAHKKDSSAGVFWLNGAETWVDIVKSKPTKNPMALGLTEKKGATQTHWMSESGLLDVFIFLGPHPGDLTREYGKLTGYTAMPQEFSVGYHQCRWNYNSDDDVKSVDKKMDKYNIPYDVIWLDIEYTDEKKYFTWDENKFKDAAGMGKHLDEHGRQLVVIIDPHIKNVGDYPIVSQLKDKDLAVKNKDGNIYDGWCWPGSSHWVDAFSPAAIEWWKSLFKYDAFKGTAENTFIWNDMNEPSVFNGPDTSMPRDNLHYGNWEHRDVHNINGMTFQNATYEALLSRKKGELRRPFVLTRSFFAGSQRVGAMWTGDNQADWGHLEASIPMILSQGISGFPFAGADVGGFFGNPDKELLTRWYQAGAFYPFFRGHAHIDARRREPYMAGEPYTPIITAALRLRYSLLPAWYTAFHQAHEDGTPILQPIFFTHPGDENALTIDDQFFLGGTGLLVKPVVTEKTESVEMYIPDGEAYYDYFTYEQYATQRGKRTTIPAPLDKIPLLMQGGHIFPRRDVPRRSAALMRFDDFTLVVTVPRADRYDAHAEGELYYDDGDSFDYERGQFVHRRFVLDGNVLTSAEAHGRDAGDVEPGSWLRAAREVRVDKVLVVGAPADWAARQEVTVESEGETWSARLEFVPAEGRRAAYATVRKVGARIGADWKLVF